MNNNNEQNNLNNQTISNQSFTQSQMNLNNNNQPKKSNKNVLVIIVVIVIIVLLVMYILSFMAGFSGVSNTLENTRKNAFMGDAKSFLSASRSLIINNSEKFSPECNLNEVKYISLADIDLLNEGSNSPFGNNYQKGSKYDMGLDFIPSDSYIKIETISNNCQYEYSIYLTDGTYSIGTSSLPILESELDATDVKK